MISESEELRDVAYRPGEYQVFGQLLVQANETAINKVHALLLLHLNRIQVPQEILSEIKSILPVCYRVCQALVDIISSFGFLSLLIKSMKLCEMLIQALWIGDSQLLQIMDRQMVNILEKDYNVKSISDFINFGQEEKNVLKLFKDKQKEKEKIEKLTNRFPYVSM